MLLRRRVGKKLERLVGLLQLFPRACLEPANALWVGFPASAWMVAWGVVSVTIWGFDANICYGYLQVMSVTCTLV
jgi:hypothetical protein